MRRATHASADERSTRRGRNVECIAARAVPAEGKAYGKHGLAVPAPAADRKTGRLRANYAFVERGGGSLLPGAEQPDRLVALEQIEKCAQRLAALAGKLGIA